MRIKYVPILTLLLLFIAWGISARAAETRGPDLDAALREWHAVLQSLPAHPYSPVALNALLEALPPETSRQDRLVMLAEKFPDQPLGLYALETLWAESPDTALVEALMTRHADTKLGGLALDMLLTGTPDVEAYCARAFLLGEVRVAQLARVRLAEQHARGGDWMGALTLQMQAFAHALVNDVKQAGSRYFAMASYFKSAGLEPLQPDWSALMVADLPAQHDAVLHLLSVLERAQDANAPLHALIRACDDTAALGTLVADPAIDPESRARGALVLAKRRLLEGEEAAFLDATTAFAGLVEEVRGAGQTVAHLWLEYLSLPEAPIKNFSRNTREQVEQGHRFAAVKVTELLKELEGDGARGIALRAAKVFEVQGRSELEVAALARALALDPPAKGEEALYKRLASVQWMTLRDYAGAAESEAWLAKHMEGMVERELATFATAVAWYLAEAYAPCREWLTQARETATVKTRDRLLYLEALVLLREGRIAEAKAALDARLQDPIPSENEAQMRALRAYLQFTTLQEPEAMAGYLETVQAFPEDRVARTLSYFLGAARPQAQPPAVQAAAIGAPNLLLISVDTMRADHLASLGYPRPATPNIDALASRGVLCEQAFSTSSWTKPAHASVFTGLYPQAHGAMAHDEGLRPEFPVMAEILRGGGYTTLGVVSAPPLHRMFGFARGFQHYDDQTYLLDRQANLFMRADNPAQVDIHSGHTSTLITESALRMLDEAHTAGQPFFLFVNYFDAHHNYQPPGPVAKAWCSPYAGAQHGAIDQWNDTPAPLDLDAHEVDVPRLLDLYGAELHHVDHQVGRLLSYLRERSLLEKTIVVLFSDHGEEFLEHGQLAHGRTLHNEVIHVPLIFAGPGVPSGKRIPSPVSLVDVFPTTLPLLGLPPQEGVQGIDLLADAALASSDNRNLYAWLDLPPYRYHAVIHNDGKLIHNLSSGDSALYDLDQDPGETQDDTAYRPEVARQLEEELERFLADAANQRNLYIGTAETRVSVPAASLDEMKAQLQALGYVAP